MEDILHITTISQLNQAFKQGKPKHPLVSVIDFSAVEGFGEMEGRFTADFYTLMFKNHCHNKIKYGREYFDFEEGTLICIAPNQVLSSEKEETNKDEVIGWGLFFHPDLIRGTSLGMKMKEYSFFSYDMKEALHLSDKEKQTLADIVLKIETELSENIDKHSQTLIVSNIELLLNYCDRYYDRQFITRKSSNTDLLSKFESVLNEYFDSEVLRQSGLPSVKYCAEKLFLSPNYLSDLLKKETGKTAQEHIHYHLVEVAKTSLTSGSRSVSEIAFDLGFEYPQHFSKLFKNKTGLSPLEYRASLQ